LGISYADEFPENYKIAGFTVFRSPNLITVEHEVFDWYDFIEKLGGWSGFLSLVCSVFMQGVSKAASHRYAWHSLYYKRKEDDQSQENASKELNITAD